MAADAGAGYATNSPRQLNSSRARRRLTTTVAGVFPWGEGEHFGLKNEDPVVIPGRRPLPPRAADMGGKHGRGRPACGGPAKKAPCDPKGATA